jgi:hypothetical protein
MRSRRLIVLALTVACTAKPAPVEDPVPGIAATRQRTITRNEFGFAWPFEVGTGTIACDGGALAFRAGGTTYALSRGAGTRTYANIDAIRRRQGGGPPTDPVSRLTQETRMKLFAQSSGCGASTGGATARGVDECKARIRDRAGISESELTRIEAEGAERFWPPAERPLMPLDPIVAEANTLCSR